MKKLFMIKKNKVNMFFLILLSSFNLLFLSSCLKNDDNEVEQIISALTVVNGAPDAPAFDFVLNRELVSSNVLFGIRIPYFYLYSGPNQASFYSRGTTTAPIYSSTINLTQGKFYSLFLTGLQTDSLTSLLTEDDLTQPATGKAKLRFINLSPDAGVLDFAIVPGSLFTSQKNFKEYTSFSEVDPGTYSATFTSSTGNSVNYNFDLKLDPGLIYTVWARGLVVTADENQAFENGLITHDR
jgi:hypothetical protein